MKPPTDIKELDTAYARLSGPSFKIGRARKHIAELNDVLTTAIYKDLYKFTPKKNLETGKNFLHVDLKFAPQLVSALLIGDAIHNLRSALDFAWYFAVEEITGSADPWTKFPVFDEREELERRINGGLKKKPNSGVLCDFIFKHVKPYKGGNDTIWGLHDLNIRDKHQLLLPMIQLTSIKGTVVENDKGSVIKFDTLTFDINTYMPIPLGGNITVKNQGTPSAKVFFYDTLPFAGKEVIPSLNRIAEEVTRTCKALFALCGVEGIDW